MSNQFEPKQTQQVVLRFPNLKLPARAGDKVRGYFGHAFKELSELFHNHREGGGFHYRYSMIQYKVIEGVPTIVGVGEGADMVLRAAHKVKELNIANKPMPVGEKELISRRETYGVSEGLHRYKLISPYFALNQKNYRTYTSLSDRGRPAFLDKMVRSHLIALHVGLNKGAKPEQVVMCSATLKPCTVVRDGQRMMMFRGEVVANMTVPPLLGIGKSTSAGFGILEMI